MPRFTHPVTIRYLEVDQQGVVFNMWYVAYFDDAMTAFLEHRGVDYAGMVASGFDVQLVHLETDWTGAARWRDAIEIAVTVASIGTTSFTLGFEVQRGAEILVTARIVYVAIATDGTGKRPLPDVLRRALSEGS